MRGTVMHTTASRRTGADPWVEDAACRATDPEAFFPTAGRVGAKDPEAVARCLCAACPVALHCLCEALRFEESSGIWGGLNVRERRELLRVAASLQSIDPALDAFLSHSRHAVRAHPRERPAYVWFMRRGGWSLRRIAGALGLTLQQVQVAWRAAEFAARVTGVDQPAGSPAASPAALPEPLPGARPEASPQALPGAPA
jgi:Transcription factor WhiB